MLEILLWYVLPNVVVFGGIWVLAKLFERAVWYAIVNYNDIKSGKTVEKFLAARKQQ